MWALGCILVELASCRRLQGSLWADTVEVNDRRNKYFLQVHERGPVLGDIAKSLLDRDATSLLSALELHVCLDKLKNCLEQHEEAAEEDRVRARALQEAEDALVARALQAEEEERMSAAAAEKQRQEEEKAAAFSASAEAAVEAPSASAEAAAALAEGARRVIA
jgi:hypothetical protein